MDNNCICCGAVIPEGQQVCPSCKRIVKADVVAIEIETHCLICGEGIPVFGGCYAPKICEKCKAAVMKVREQDGK